MEYVTESAASSFAEQHKRRPVARHLLVRIGTGRVSR
jgi:hypothetical protein